MATSVTWNNTSYSIPAAGELNWSALSDFLIALGGGAGQPGAQVSGKVQKFGMRVATASPVTVSDVNDCVIVVDLTVAGASTVNLPAGVTGRVFMVVDGKGDAASNNITLDGNGSQTIQGSLTYTMNVNKSAVLLGFDGTEWKIIGAYEGASIPDSRLATISTAGKVANSATTATDANTNSAIVARDASGNFSAGTITATLSGSATNFSGSLSGDVTGTQGATAISATTVTGKALTGFVSGAGSVSATDTILQAFNKIDGNVAGKEPTITTLAASKGGLATDASAFTGVVKASSGTFSAATLVNADVSASAAIDHSKLANITAGSVLLGNASNVPTATALTGDVTVNSTGVTAISSGVIVNADVNASAAIAGTKISPDFGSQNVTTTGSLGGTNVLNAGYEEFTEIATPSTPAAGKIRIYGKTDGKMYQLDDAGNEKAIGSGSGSGGVNYLVDWYDATKAVGTVSTVAVGGNVTVSGSFPAVTSAWYADTTSGSAAIASSSNNTLRGTTNYLTALSGVSTSGATFVQSPVFNIDGEDLGKALTVQFDISGVTTDDDWDVVAVRYNSSGVYQELIPIAGNVSTMTGTPSAKLPLGVKQFNGFFITGSTASDVYAIRWRRRAGSAQIRLDSLTVGPQQVLQGAIVTDWQSFTPTVLGFGAESSKSAFYRRVGNVMEVRCEFVGGISTAVTGSVSLPTGFTVDSTTITTTSPVGYHFTSKGTADKKGGAVLVAGGGTVFNFSNYGTFGTTATNPLAAALGTAICENGDQFCFYASIPITEWQSNTQMAARAVEEYAYNTDLTATATVVASGFANGPQGGQFSSLWAVGTTYKRGVRFQTPILPTDQIIVEFKDNNLQWVPLALSRAGSAKTVQASKSYGVGVEQTTSTDLEVSFYDGGREPGATYGVNGAAWSTLSSTSFGWRVRKVSSGAAVGFPVGARNVIGDTTGTAVPANMIGQEVVDTRLRSASLTRTTAQSNVAFQVTANGIVLPPGVWDICASVAVEDGSAGTAITRMNVGISNVSGTFPGGSDISHVPNAQGEMTQNYQHASVTLSGQSAYTITPYRFVNSAQTTLYLIAQPIFTTANLLSWGRIRAVRVG